MLYKLNTRKYNLGNMEFDISLTSHLFLVNTYLSNEYDKTVILQYFLYFIFYM